MGNIMKSEGYDDQDEGYNTGKILHLITFERKILF